MKKVCSHFFHFFDIPICVVTIQFSILKEHNSTFRKVFFFFFASCKVSYFEHLLFGMDTFGFLCALCTTAVITVVKKFRMLALVLQICRLCDINPPFFSLCCHKLDQCMSQGK